MTNEYKSWFDMTDEEKTQARKEEARNTLKYFSSQRSLEDTNTDEYVKYFPEVEIAWNAYKLAKLALGAAIENI